MLTIRPLTADDFQAVRVIDEEIQREYRGTDWDRLGEREKRRFLWYGAGFQPAADLRFCFVACESERVVGFVMAFVEPVRSRRTLCIDGVAVVSEYRRVGAAAALYERLIERARREGVGEILSRISLDNEPSLGLHRKLGFELTQCIEATLVLD